MAVIKKGNIRSSLVPISSDWIIFFLYKNHINKDGKTKVIIATKEMIIIFPWKLINLAKSKSMRKYKSVPYKGNKRGWKTQEIILENFISNVFNVKLYNKNYFYNSLRNRATGIFNCSLYFAIVLRAIL